MKDQKKKGYLFTVYFKVLWSKVYITTLFQNHNIFNEFNYVHLDIHAKISQSIRIYENKHKTCNIFKSYGSFFPKIEHNTEKDVTITLKPFVFLNYYFFQLQEVYRIRGVRHRGVWYQRCCECRPLKFGIVTQFSVFVNWNFSEVRWLFFKWNT